jgi:hypothetical protein
VQWRNQSYVVLWVENVCVLIDFIYENDLVALGRKSLLDWKKSGLALGR